MSFWQQRSKSGQNYIPNSLSSHPSPPQPHLPTLLSLTPLVSPSHKICHIHLLFYSRINWSLNLLVSTSVISLQMCSCLQPTSTTLIQTFLSSYGNYYNGCYSLVSLILFLPISLCAWHYLLPPPIFPKHSDGHVSLQFTLQMQRQRDQPLAK